MKGHALVYHLYKSVYCTPVNLYSIHLYTYGMHLYTIREQVYTEQIYKLSILIVFNIH